MGMWVVMAGPRVRVARDMGTGLGMVKVWRLKRDSMGMLVVLKFFVVLKIQNPSLSAGELPYTSFLSWQETSY